MIVKTRSAVKKQI